MRPPRWFVLLLAVLLISGHTAGLQVVAWIGMTVERAQTMPFAEALRSSLDGSQPCGICRAVVDLAGEAPQAPTVVQPKPDAVPQDLPVAVIAPSLLTSLPVPEPLRFLREWRGDVPTPPPQGI